MTRMWFFCAASYEAFVKVAKRELPETMELLFPDSYRDGKAFFDFTPRLFTKTAAAMRTARRCFLRRKLNHLWVDLFILDKLPAGRGGAAFTRFLHKAIYGLAMGHRPGLDFKKYSLLHKIFVGRTGGGGKTHPLKAHFCMQKAAALKDRNSRGDKWYYSITSRITCM